MHVKLEDDHKGSDIKKLPIIFYGNGSQDEPWSNPLFYSKLLSLMPKFERAFTMSSLLWNQGACSLPVLTYSLVYSCFLQFIDAIECVYYHLNKKKYFAFLSQASNHRKVKCDRSSIGMDVFFFFALCNRLTILICSNSFPFYQIVAV